MISCSWRDSTLSRLGDDYRNIQRIRFTTTKPVTEWFECDLSSGSERSLRKDLPVLQEAHIFDGPEEMCVHIYGSRTWTSIGIPLTVVQSNDPVTSTVRIESKQCGVDRKCQPPWIYDYNCHSDTKNDDESVQKLIDAMSPLSERHLMRLQMGEGFVGSRNSNLNILIGKQFKG
jgi:hypothetical protein